MYKELCTYKQVLTWTLHYMKAVNVDVQGIASINMDTLHYMKDSKCNRH